MESLLKLINFYDTSFFIAVMAIIFNPLFWNLQSCGWKKNKRKYSRCFGSDQSSNKSFSDCSKLWVIVDVLTKHCMTIAMKAQPRWELMNRAEVFYAGTALIVAGTVLVVSSFLALGFTGTFLGDYFGILLDEKVTVFPFNVMENPMYWGSTANYLGLALIGASPVGLILTATVAAVYKVAIQFEGPFTAQIYRERSQSRKHE
uniref:Phosphatidylethanolamine N-methyltransferase n=2 Tax=Tetraodon nigroviridis TaxID=99883 RepID=H3CPN0_TETNG